MKGYVMNVNTGVIYPSAHEACRRCYITCDAMSHLLNGTRKRSRDMSFCYVPDEVISGYPGTLARFRLEKLAELANVQGIEPAGLSVFFWTEEGLEEVG